MASWEQNAIADLQEYVGVLEQKIQRLETLVACLVVHGDNLPSFDNGPKVAREIIVEIADELGRAGNDG